MTDQATRRWPAAVAAALVLFVAACTSTTSEGAGVGPRAPSGSDPATPSSQPAGDTPEVDWASCHEDYECTTLQVPLDHDDPEGATIDLAVIRRPASNPGDKVGSLVMNPGGPGASGIDFLTNARFSDDLEQSFDLVSWDPRGIGLSDALHCEDTADDEGFRELDSDPDSPDEQATLEDSSKTIAAQCGAADLPLLEHSTTTDTAHDLEAIRAAVGDPGLTYMGFSYGTQIGQEYARLYPDRVRAMVLDGVVDPSQPLQELLADQAAVIETTFSPPTLALYDELIAQAERQPLHGPAGTELTPGIMAPGIAASYYPQGDTALHNAAQKALDGNPARLEQIALSYSDGTSFVDYLAVSCTDSPFAPGVDAWNHFAAEMKADAPRFGAPTANELLPCAFWPVAPRRETSEIAIPGLPPILVVGTTDDPATPYESAQRVAAAIPGAVLLTLDGFGHTAFGKSACIDDAVATYLIELETPPPGTVCQPDSD